MFALPCFTESKSVSCVNLLSSLRMNVDRISVTCDLDVALVVWWLVCLPLDPKVVGSNPAKTMNL
jgi:hypothetical protein